jgi:hypothetical protein
MISQTPQWLQLVQAIGAMATTVGVLTALYIAVIRDPRNASKEHIHHLERMEALHRVQMDRAGAQARKVVPSCGRIPMFGDTWWAVRIDNASNAMTAIHGVSVTALDANGFKRPDGCRPADNTVPFDEAFQRAVSAGQSEARNDLVPAVKEALRDILSGHLVKRWPRTLAPNHYAVMAYTTTDPTYELRITIDYEDEAGYPWQRTNASQPRRMDG